LKGPIQSIEVSYFVHATEDPEIIAKAVLTLLSANAEPEEEKLEGHFGNTIIHVRYHLTGDDAALALSRVSVLLTTPTKERLKENIEELVDEHSALYLRLDKQCLIIGRLEEGRGDPIRIRVKPRGFLLRSGAKEFYSKSLFGGR